MKVEENRTPYQRNALDQSSTFYLTLVSIIDSLALGFFLTEVDGDSLFVDASLAYWLKSAAIIQAMILVWYEYMVGTLLFRWILNHFDAAIPFAIAICLYSMVKLINNPMLQYWFMIFSIFSVLGLIAHINQHFQSRRYSENKAVLEVLDKRHLIVFVFEGGSAVVLAGISFAYMLWQLSPTQDIAMLVILNAMLLGYAVAGHFIFWRRAFV